MEEALDSDEGKRDADLGEERSAQDVGGREVLGGGEVAMSEKESIRE